MRNPIFRFFSSVRLTVVLLVLACIMTFWGTLAQVHEGLFKAQTDFFRSFLIYWQPGGLKIPIFPGGYLIGTMLLLNLFAGHIRYYKSGKRKIGIILIHIGVMLLLVGQMLTDALAVESQMHLRDGETKNYSESTRNYELAVTDTSNTNYDTVVAIPTKLLARGREIKVPELPFAIRAKTFFANSSLVGQPQKGYTQPQITAGGGQNVWWRQLPRETAMNAEDMPSATIAIASPQKNAGTFLVSTFLEQPQHFTFGGRDYEMILRSQRFYTPYSIHLIDFRHDVYPGTDIPKNFSSRIRLQNPVTGEDREILIHMNDPLRYDGKTFYQASFDADNHGSILQVVHNPSWLTPYFACALVAIGLVWQFLSHLIPFLKKGARPPQPPSESPRAGQKILSETAKR